MSRIHTKLQLKKEDYQPFGLWGCSKPFKKPTDYHLHSEAKFFNVESLNSRVTARSHVRSIALEYFGKEYNR